MRRTICIVSHLLSLPACPQTFSFLAAIESMNTDLHRFHEPDLSSESLKENLGVACLPSCLLDQLPAWPVSYALECRPRLRQLPGQSAAPPSTSLVVAAARCTRLMHVQLIETNTGCSTIYEACCSRCKMYTIDARPVDRDQHWMLHHLRGLL